MRKIFTFLVFLFDLAFLVYVLGPRVERPVLDVVLPDLGVSIDSLEVYIKKKEAAFEIKPGNEAQVIWADSTHQKTPYSVVYLHGWSASHMEGDPIHKKIAKDLGANLFLARLADHGLSSEEALLHITANSLVDSAKEALSIAQILGEKVIVMATSNGGALALYLAPSLPELEALILYSPNIEIYDSTAALLDDPWGLQIAKLVKGSDYHVAEMPESRKAYWYDTYRLESLPHLQAFVSETMTPRTFERVSAPVFMGYYYKNEEEQDKVVSVGAMLDMFDALATPDSLKQKRAFPEAGDHILASPLASKDTEGVYLATKAFLREVVQLSL